jgi:hypothetical protein
MKIYISGKISGLEREHVLEKFTAAERHLKDKGFNVVNPINNGLPWDAPWESHMAMDIIHLLSCDAIFLLPCWSDSKGAMLEKKIAELTGKKIWSQAADYKQEEIRAAVLEATGISMEIIESGNRTEMSVFAKYILVRLYIEMGLHPSMIARLINRSVKNIQYSLRKYNESLAYSRKFKHLDQKVRSLLS